LYLGFFERHRQLLPLGFGLAGPVDTRSVLRGAGSLTRDGDGVGELLITGACRDVSYCGGGAPMYSCAMCCIGLGSAPA
jgi:hypothetical protein